MNNDLISRSALKKEFGYTDEWYKSRTVTTIIDNASPVEITDYDTGYQDGLEDGLNDIRPQGEWIYRNYNWWCSICGEQPKTMGYVGTAKFMYDEFKFCNHCGAKMAGGADMRVKDELNNELK